MTGGRIIIRVEVMSDKDTAIIEAMEHSIPIEDYRHFTNNSGTLDMIVARLYETLRKANEV